MELVSRTQMEPNWVARRCSLDPSEGAEHSDRLGSILDDPGELRFGNSVPVVGAFPTEEGIRNG